MNWLRSEVSTPSGLLFSAATKSSSSNIGGLWPLGLLVLLILAFAFRKRIWARFANLDTTKVGRGTQIGGSIFLFGAMIVGGVLLVAVGTYLKHHFQTAAAICDTFGTDSGGSVASCTANGTAYSIGQYLQIIGAVVIGAWLILGIASLVVHATRPNGDVAANTSRASNRPKRAS